MNFDKIASLRRLAERPGTEAEGEAAHAAIKRLQDSDQESFSRGTGFLIADSYSICGEDELDKAFDALADMMRDSGF